MAGPEAPRQAAASGGTDPPARSLPQDVHRDIQVARYLSLLAIPFVALLYFDMLIMVAYGGILPIVAGLGALYVALIYIRIYRSLTRGEVSKALGAALVLGVLSFALGLMTLALGLGLDQRGDLAVYLLSGTLPVFSLPAALARIILILGAVGGILLLLVYLLGARAERRLQAGRPLSSP